jgi:hypothetical protein
LFVCVTSFFSGCGQKDKNSEVVHVNKEKKPLSEKQGVSKINGVSFVASKDTLTLDNIAPLIDIHANFASIMPFGFIKSLDHPTIIYNQERQWFGETKQGVLQYINLLHKNKIHVMLKPQIWVWHGEFTGLVEMASEEDWQELEASYCSFILDFAEVAEEGNVEIFCIGTELEKFIENRPGFWRELIAEVRTVYKGKLTYAANWDEYKRVPFWDALDYIGLDAYFPVSESKTPTVAEARAGWQRWKKEMKAFSKKQNKKILFAEYGYRSVDFAGKEPWISDRAMTSINMSAQTNTLQALYEEVWKENWFVGGFLWKWFITHGQVGGKENNQFTPQNKPAETVVKRFYTEN